MQKFGRALSGASRAATVLGGLAIALMMLHVTGDVIMRYVFNSPLPGTLTVVTYYYMILATFLPLAFAERRQAHISVEIATDMMSRRVRHHLKGWIYLPTALIMGLFAWRSLDAGLSAYDLGATQVQGATRIAVWPAYFALPVGAGLMAAMLVLRFLNYLFGFSVGLEDDNADEALS